MIGVYPGLQCLYRTNQLSRQWLLLFLLTRGLTYNCCKPMPNQTHLLQHLWRQALLLLMKSRVLEIPEWIVWIKILMPSPPSPMMISNKSQGCPPWPASSSWSATSQTTARKTCFWQLPYGFCASHLQYEPQPVWWTAGTTTFHWNQRSIPTRRWQQPSSTNPGNAAPRERFDKIPYTRIIAKALATSPNGELKLSEIYKYCEQTYDMGRLKTKWQNDMHNWLSLTFCFVRIKKEDTDIRGGTWTYDQYCWSPSDIPTFVDRAEVLQSKPFLYETPRMILSARLRLHEKTCEASELKSIQLLTGFWVSLWHCCVQIQVWFYHPLHSPVPKTWTAITSEYL